MRVLVAAIGPLSGTGYATRLASMVRAYTAAGWTVDLLQARDESQLPPGVGTMSQLRDYIPVTLPDLRPRDHFSSLPPLARLLASHLPAGLGSRTYDVAQAESSAIWPAVEATAAAAKILVLHDDDSIRYRRIAKQVRDPRRKLVREAAAIKYARFQRQAIREADQVWFVSEPELQRLGDSTGKFVLVSNGATAGFFEIPVGADPARRIVTFVGPATYDANRRAVEFFVGRIWPLVRAQVGDAELRLVGEGWGETAHAATGVYDRGWVEDLPAEVGQATVVIAPLLDGGGTKIKVLEAMAAARPVVATAIAAEGIPDSNGLCIADEPGAFANCVTLFLSDAALATEAGETNRRAVDGLEWSAIWRRAMAESGRLAWTGEPA